jgi:hypothetical protein
MRRRPPARALASSRSRLVAPTHYALARHRPTRGLWVFAVRAETVVGVCGPLEGDPPPAWLLPHFDFDSTEARANLPVVRAHLAEFERLA